MNVHDLGTDNGTVRATSAEDSADFVFYHSDISGYTRDVDCKRIHDWWSDSRRNVLLPVYRTERDRRDIRQHRIRADCYNWHNQFCRAFVDRDFGSNILQDLSWLSIRCRFESTSPLRRIPSLMFEGTTTAGIVPPYNTI